MSFQSNSIMVDVGVIGEERTELIFVENYAMNGLMHIKGILHGHVVPYSHPVLILIL